jgi:hypothetical protein
MESYYWRNKERLNKQSKEYRQMRKKNPDYVPRSYTRVVREQEKKKEAIYIKGDKVIGKDTMGRFTREGKVIKEYENFILVDMGKYIESFKREDIRRK